MPFQFTEDDFARLRNNTLVDEVVYLDEVDSTNNHAKTLYGESSVLVLCGKQSSGRGRGGNVWQAPEGCLSFSLRVNVKSVALEQRHWPLTSLFTAIALARSLVEWTPPGCVGLKWPNDVMLNGRKTAGILLEVAPDKTAVIMGVGLNFSNDVADLQGKLDQPATSLTAELEDGALPSPVDVLEKFVLEWDAVRKLLLEDNVPVDSLWNAFGVLRNRQVSLKVSEQDLSGLCHGLDTDGALLIETAGGIQRCYTGTGLRLLS